MSEQSPTPGPDTHDKEIAEIRKAFHLLCLVHDKGAKNKPLWFKSLILLAYRASKINLTKDVLNLVSAVDRSYLTDTVPAQMAEDKLFADCVMALATYLVDNKLATVMKEAATDLKPTQKPALA